MSNMLLYIAGTSAMLVAIVHGYIGANKVVGPSIAPSPQAKRILHAIMFLSAVYWFVAGGILVAVPHLFEGETRRWVIYVCSAVLGSGALGNMWGTRFKHFGGYLLGVITVLAIAGV